MSGSKTLKKINKNYLEKNEEFIITNLVGNISQEVLTNVKTFEILPTNGDESSHYSGNYTITIDKLNDNQKLYYTRNKNIDKNNIDINEFIEVKENDTIPSDAYAIYSIIDSIDVDSDISYNYHIKPNNNNYGDTYVFSMEVSSDNLSTILKTNKAVARVVNRNISGTSFIDENNNDILDNEDKLLSNTKVKLINSNNKVVKTTYTNDVGIYTFDNLDKDSYIVEFETKGNYSVINKGIDDLSSKVNSNGKTDTIKFDNNLNLVNIDNINYGLSYDDINVVSHYYIDGTTTKLASDNTDKYNHNEEYTTVISSDIPNNYELKEMPINYKGTTNDTDIDVIYYFVKKSSNLTTSISKTATETIDSLDSKIDYKIIYNANIDEYVGNGTIEIVDYLPYEIDLDKSNLGTGIYNRQDKTITFTEEWNNIDTYNKQNTVKEIEKDISIVYKDIDINNLELENKVISKTILDNNTDTKESKVITNIKIPTTITIYYKEKASNKDLLKKQVINGYVGEDYKAKLKNIKNYKLLNNKTDYKFEMENKDIIFEYKKSNVVGNPQTSDLIFKYIIIFIVSILGISISIFKFKKTN